MFQIRLVLDLLKRFMQRPVVILAALWAALASPLEAELTRDDVLSIQHGRFFLEGRLFAEISFNKFDLFWQLYGELAAGRTLDAANPMVQAQDRALRDLHEMGFRTIRIFALPWGPSGLAAYADPAKRQMLYAALAKPWNSATATISFVGRRNDNEPIDLISRSCHNRACDAPTTLGGMAASRS